MKLFRVGLALVYGLYCSQALALDKVQDTAGKDQAPIGVVELAKKVKLTDMSGKSFKKLWAGVADFIPQADKAAFEAALKTHPDFIMPKIEVIELNKQNGIASIRVLIQLKTDTLSMEFHDDPVKPLSVNGVAFSQEDIQNMSTIFAKLAKDVKFKDTFESMKPVATNMSILHFLGIVYAGAIPTAFADVGGCKEKMDQIFGPDVKSPEEIEQRPAQMVKDGTLGNMEIKADIRCLQDQSASVCSTDGPECERVKLELKAMQHALKKNSDKADAEVKDSSKGKSSGFLGMGTAGNWIAGLTIGALAIFAISKIFYHKVKSVVNPGITSDPTSGYNTGSGLQ